MMPDMVTEAETIAGTDGDSPRYLPDEETIRRECLLIQAEWSPEEERKRRAVQPCREVYLGGVVRIGE